ncbi:MAG: hypothetical protein ACOC98_03745 [Thermodesulfobacteriota bacterium]
MDGYDIATKVLLDTCRDDIIRYLLGIPVRESRILDPLPQETVSVKRGDFPVMMTDESGGRELVVLEVYTDWKWTIPLHLMDYRARYMLQHKVQAISCVILFRPSAAATDLYEDREIRFQYRLIKIYEMDAAQVVAEGPLCMLPFVPLMRGGEAALDEAEALIYDSERSRPEKGDMLTSMAILSGLVSPDMPAKLVSRRKDIMVESAAYDIIKREGVAEGAKKTAKNLIELGILTDEQIAQAVELTVEEIRELRRKMEK